jgi:hypothetical protein
MSGTTLGQLGALGYVMTDLRMSFDPSVGSIFEADYEGSRDAIRIASALWTSRGGRVNIEENGPISKATATFSGNRNPNNPEQAAFVPPSSGSTESDANGEVPTDRFEIRSNKTEVSIFALPFVEFESLKWASDPQIGAGATTALYRKILEDAAKDGAPLPFNPVTYPVSKVVYQMLARGQETFPTTRISLSRISTYSATYSRPTRIEAFPSAYKTASLVRAFNIPLSVANALPLDPEASVTPRDTAWAWYREDFSQSYVLKNNHVEEHTSWVFGAIDALVFKII